MKRILVLGSSNIDHVVRVNAFPQSGETLTAVDYQTSFGGKGANQAVACARTGGRVDFFSALGDDEWAKTYRSHLKKTGVDIRHVKDLTQQRTGCAFIQVDRASENLIVVVPGANHAIEPHHLNDIEWRRYRWVIAQMELKSEVTLRLLEIARREAFHLVLNPSPYQHFIRDHIDACHQLILNESEALALFEKCSFRELTWTAIRKRFRGNLSVIVVTLGAKGAVVFTPRQRLRLQGRPVEALDTVGAGDCFAGSYVSSLEAGYTLKESVHRAIIASSISVTRKGAQESYPTKWEINRALHD
jgi:ribokinase